MGTSYITDLDNHTLTEENLINVKRKMLVGNIRMLIISLAMLTVSLTGIPRIRVFIDIFSADSNVFQIVGISLYGCALLFLVMYYLINTIYILANVKKNDYWVYIVYRRKKRLDLIDFTCKCLSIFLFFLIFILNPCTVEGTSMAPTFESNDKVICTDVFYYPKKNDVIVFDASKYSSERKNELYIKRIVATQGDIITYSNNIFYVNGEEEQYQMVSKDDFKNILNWIKARGGETAEDYGVIPTDMALVFGDNRNSSYDSRRFGPIYNKDIYGKVILRLYPFTKMKFF